MSAQAGLPFEETPAPECDRGRHPEERDGEPIDLGDCVNVEHFCVLCGVNTSVTSWGKDAWLKDQAKRKS